MIKFLILNKFTLLVFLLVSGCLMVTVVAPDQVGISGITWTNKDAGVVPDTGGRTAYGTLVHKNTEPRVFVFPDVTGNVVLTTNANRLSNKTINNSTFDGISINSPVILNSRISGITPLEVASGGLGKTVLSGFFDSSNFDFSRKLRLSKFQNNGIENIDLDGEFDTYKFATNSVTTIKIADNAVGSLQIKRSEVTSIKIGSGAIDTRHLRNGVIGNTLSIVGGSTFVYGNELALNSISTRHIQTDAVNSSKISNGTITLADMNSNVVLPPPSTGGNHYHWGLSGLRSGFIIVQHSYSGTLGVYGCNSNTNIRLQVWRNNTRVYNVTLSAINRIGLCRDRSITITGNSLQVGDVLYISKLSDDLLFSHYIIYEAD